MKINLTLIILIVSIQSADLLSQKETFNWFFGDSCGISFNTADNSPVFVNGCVLNQMEGTSTISDKDGRLLFYSDGKYIWNGRNEFLDNGGGLLGYNSSSRSAILLPRPYSNRYYYLFTIDAFERWVDSNGQYYNPNGLRYSVIDRFLSPIKGGDIDINKKNILLLENAIEKLIAVNHSNGADIWLITYNWKDNYYYVYLITKDGIQQPQKFRRPFDSIIHPKDATFNLDYDISSRRLIDCDNSLNSFIIYDFNTTTGQINTDNPLILPAYHKDNIAEDSIQLYVPYSGAFSQDGMKFYGSCYQRCIIQYDLSNVNNNNEIIDSYHIIADKNTENIKNILFGAIRKGPDNKIYVARDKYGYIGVISEPNEAKNECNFISDGLYLEGKKSRYGLPIMLEYKLSPCEYDGYAGGNKQICAGSNVVLGDISAETFNLEFEWFPKDYLDNPYTLNPICYAQQSTQYILMIKNTDLDCFDYDTINITVNEAIKYLPSNDFEICPNSSVVLGNPNNDDNLVYEWNPTIFLDNPFAKNPISIPTRDIQYILTIKDTTSGCLMFDTINVKMKMLNVKIDGSPFICEGKNTTLTVDGDYVSYLWSNGSTTKSITIDIEGIYWVKVQDTEGCEGVKNIEIKYLVAENFNIIAPNTICSDIPVTLRANAEFYSYLWSTGDTTPTIEIVKGGNYWLLVENENGCQIADTCYINETNISFIVNDSINFGYICIEKQTDTTTYFINTSEEIMLISDVYLANNTNFKLNNNETQYTLNSNDTLAFNLNFTPNGYNSYLDTLIVKIATPCETIIYIPLKAATDNNIFNVTIPNTETYIGDTTIIPINIIYPNNNQNFQFLVDIKYRWDIIQPIYCENATITNKKRDALWETITIQTYYPANNNQIILPLYVKTTLGNDYVSQIFVCNLQTEINCYEWNTDTATIKLLGCALDYYKIQFFSPTIFNAYTYLDKINYYMSSSEIGNFKLIIFDILGNECYKKEWINNEKALINKKEEISDINLVNGIYLIQLITPNDNFINKVIINK